MQAELKKLFSAEVTLVPGHGGVFRVKVDGKIVFDKHQVGRFPEEGEIISALQNRNK